MEHGRADSRAKAAQHHDPVLRHATSEGLDGNAALISQEPSLRDLAETLVFSPSDGRIWLNDQRMILLQSASLGVLRRELIESLGTEKARQLLTRIGYASGSRDAELIRRRWPQGDAFRAGPHIHSLEGVVKVTPLRLAMDVDVDHGANYGATLSWPAGKGPGLGEPDVTVVFEVATCASKVRKESTRTEPDADQFLGCQMASA